MKRALALLVLLPALALAGTAIDSYLDLEAEISSPDGAEAGVPFDVEVYGFLHGGSAFSVTAWQLWQDATWSYNAAHMVDVESGTLIAADGFHWGDVLKDGFEVDPGAGEHTYLFVFGQRSFAHGWYDLAVETGVQVLGLCDLDWLPPLQGWGNAGRTLPLKFTAADCETGDFALDEDLVVQAIDAQGDVVYAWDFTDDKDGVYIAGGHYKLLWDTEPGDAGEWTIEVLFSTGDVLTREVALR